MAQFLRHRCIFSDQSSKGVFLVRVSWGARGRGEVLGYVVL